MIMTSSFFAIKGRVGKNIKHTGTEYPLTFFSVGVVVGREKEGTNFKWDSIPIVCNRDVKINAGDYVVVTGAVRMTKKESDKYPTMSLFADSIAILEKKEDPPEAPTTEVYTGERVSIRNSDYADADIPF